MGVHSLKFLCPNCQHSTGVNKAKLLGAEIIQCKECKEEFVSPKGLDEFEKEFWWRVLIEGEQRGLWKVDIYITGGRKGISHVLGIDFRIRRGESEVWIEYKNGHTLSFTESQIKRFKTVRDTATMAWRVIGTVTSRDYPDEVKVLVYWTPNFVRVIPEGAWGKPELAEFRGAVGSKKNLRLGGMAKCIFKNSYTEYHEKYTGANLEHLLSTPNWTIFKLTRGFLGNPGSRFEYRSKESAFELIIKKLQRTLQKPNEDVGYFYTECAYHDQMTDQRAVDKIVDEVIWEYIKGTYRLVYVSDLADRLITEPLLDAVIKHNVETNKWFIRGQDLAPYISWRLGQYLYDPDDNPKGRIKVAAKIKERNAYGLRGLKYILISLGGSRLLDDFLELYKYINKSGSVEKIADIYFTTKELAKIINVPLNEISWRVTRYREELINLNLIVVKNRGKFKPICLTQRAIDYLMREGEFAL